MQNILNALTELLSKDDRLVVEGKLLKNKVIELALAMDGELIKLLLKDKAIKKHFFTDVDGILVFDKIKFQRFVSNKEFLPNSYTAFKNKIGLVDEQGEYITNSQDVVLAWPYKDCVLEGGQTKEDQKRDEIFWNETLAPDEIDRLLAPKVFTGWKKYDSKGEHELTGKEKIDFKSENLIIRGNNLLALHSLSKYYAGQVKLIYIDPPYNTGNDSFKYNDNFNHSTWLTFMKNRLTIAKTLLRRDGVIFISIDDTELFHLKVLCDEIFGNHNYIRTIAYQRGESSGIGQSGTLVLNTTEYILIYGIDKSNVCFNDVFNIFEIDKETMKRYKSILKSPGERKLIKSFTSKSNGEEVKIFKHKDENIESVSLKDFENRISEIKLIFMNNHKKIFRTTNPQSDFQQEIISEIGKGLYSVDYVPSRGKKKGILTTNYFYDKGLCAWLHDTSEIINKSIFKKEKINDFWAHGDIPKADLANEGNVTLKRGKKPEQLLKRIFELCTNENDLVLDFFSGSGTSSAVAHKMGRRYIGIEQLDYDKNDSVVRLTNVIGKQKKDGLIDILDKYDESGVSKSVKWQGGGSFIYCELAEWNEAYISEIKKSKTLNELLSIWKDIQGKSFISYKIDTKTINENISDFEKLPLEDQKKFLIETLDKNQLYVNYSEIEDEDYKISDTDKKLNRMFYGEV